MLKIRLQRVGRRNIPRFRVVLTDSRNSTKSGKYLEVLGSYNPVHDKKEVDVERVKHWLSKGAQPTGTVYNFFIDQKILSGKKKNVLPRRKPVQKEAPAQAAQAGASEASAPTAGESALANKEQTAEVTPVEAPAESN